MPEGLKLDTFPESDWAQFGAKGPLPSSLQALNTQVWQEWYPNEEQKYIGNGNAMLEVLCRELEVPYTLLKTDIREIVFGVRQEDNP